MTFIILLLAQPTFQSFPDFESFWDFYADNRISSSACGMGYTGVASTGDISSTFINPASLSLVKNKKQIYFEYVYKDAIGWIADIKCKNLNPNFSVGLGLPINDYFQTGITYRIEKSKKTDYGEIIGTVVSDTAEEGYIEVGPLEAYKNVKIRSLSVPLVFTFKDMLSVGVDLSYTNFYSKTSLGESKYIDTLTDSTWAETNIFTASLNKIRLKFGIIFLPIKGLSLGFTYLPQTEGTVTDDLGDTYVPNVFPRNIGIGISYKLEPIPLFFSFNYKYSNNSVEEGLVDRKDIHFGLGYDINDNFTIKCGFFTQKDYRSQSLQSNTSEIFGLSNYDQIFTTFGLSYKISSLALNLSLMDSDLLSDGSIVQTYVNTGVSYDF
jgi:hypothetical protein